MKKETKNKSASIKQLLLNISRSSGKSFNEIFQYYAMERWLYRLSKSNYKNNFILKGALLFNALNIDISRSTKDIDLLGRIDNNIENISKVMKEICLQEVEDDGIIFDDDSIVTEPIVKDSSYQGVRVSFNGNLGSAKINIQIDIGFGDIVTPFPINTNYPVILNLSFPEIIAYSLETVIAEKFEAIVKLGLLNSRIKDFFDIWLLSQKFSFDGETLSNAIKATFQNRGTELLLSPIAWKKEFIEDKTKQLQWKAFIHKKSVKDIPESLEIVILDIVVFLKPIVQSLLEGKNFNMKWENKNWL